MLAATMRQVHAPLSDERLRLLLEQLRVIGGMQVTIRAVSR